MQQVSNRFPAGAGIVACVLGLGAAAPAQGQVTYSGQATAAVVGAQVFADTGELPPEGGLLSASQDALQTGVATAQNLAAQTSGGNQVANSSASLEVGTLLTAATAVVVGSLRAEASAACDGASVQAQGSSTIVGLTIGGVPVEVTGEPGQVVPLPDGTLILNQQAIDTIEGGLVIHVDALRLIPLDGPEVVLGRVRGGLAGCTAPPVDCPDFVTGNGSIDVGGGQGSFGFQAGFKPNSSTPSISFNYIDHLTKRHVKAQTIEAYELLGPNVRRFTGIATSDGTTVEYTITVADNGEPGTGDTFEMALSDGHAAGGTTLSGNIQLHKPCP